MDKARLTASAPILLVSDIEASAKWYCDKLGFTNERFYGEPPSFCMLFRDHLCVMLSSVKDKSEIKPHWKIVEKMWNIYFWVDDVEKLYDEFKNSGAMIDYELYVTPYKVKEFGINDPDGYDIAFGQPA